VRTGFLPRGGEPSPDAAFTQMGRRRAYGDIDMATKLLSRVLLTNDDGIDAPGLAALEHAAKHLADEVWIVAPAHDQSGTSHSISLHDPLRLERLGDRRFALSGTPGDCAAIGIRHLMLDTPPDLLLSGVNRGANLGVETVFSGTVGAAMTGMLLGIPSIALSQAFSDGAHVRWDTSRALVPDVIRQLVALDWSHGACMNVNFPDCSAEQAQPLKLTAQGRGLLTGIGVITRTDPRNKDYHWLKLERSPEPDDSGTEAAALAAHHVTATPLRFERTHEGILSNLQRQMAARLQET